MQMLEQMCACTWKPEADDRCVFPSHSITAFETGWFPEPETRLLGQPDWLNELQGPFCLYPPTTSTGMTDGRKFYKDTEVQNSSHWAYKAGTLLTETTSQPKLLK